jgi:hypothetical protein
MHKTPVGAPDLWAPLNQGPHACVQQVGRTLRAILQVKPLTSVEQVRGYCTQTVGKPRATTPIREDAVRRLDHGTCGAKMVRRPAARPEAQVSMPRSHPAR